MSQAVDILRIAQGIESDLSVAGVARVEPQCESSVPYSTAVTNAKLREKTQKLFVGGHYARSVEEACKLIDNMVKRRTQLKGNSLSGAKLMSKAFSEQNPILKLNELSSESESDEQKGLMLILSGFMTGVRNPRAHDSDWSDSSEEALRLLSFANYLLDRIEAAELVE